MKTVSVEYSVPHTESKQYSQARPRLNGESRLMRGNSASVTSAATIEHNPAHEPGVFVLCIPILRPHPLNPFPPTSFRPSHP